MASISAAPICKRSISTSLDHGSVGSRRSGTIDPALLHKNPRIFPSGRWGVLISARDAPCQEGKRRREVDFQRERSGSTQSQHEQRSRRVVRKAPNDLNHGQPNGGAPSSPDASRGARPTLPGARSSCATPVFAISRRASCLLARDTFRCLLTQPGSSRSSPPPPHITAVVTSPQGARQDTPVEGIHLGAQSQRDTA